MITIARPERARDRGAVEMYRSAVVSIVPHSGSPDPAAEAEEPETCDIDDGRRIASVPATITGEMEFGRMWLVRITRFRTPIDRAAST